jgi:hypothetical protein
MTEEERLAAEAEAKKKAEEEAEAARKAAEGDKDGEGDGDKDGEKDKKPSGLDKRIAKLLETNKELQARIDQQAAAQKEAEQKSLAEQGKFKELYEQQIKESEAQQARLNDEIARNRFLVLATKKGVVDPEGAFILAKAAATYGSTVSVGKDGAVSGIDTVLESLLEEKPYLIGKAAEGDDKKPEKKPVGSSSNPGAGGGKGEKPKTLAEAGNELERRLASGQMGS